MQGMALIDTHTHLDSFARRGELPAVLQRARDAGIEGMIAIGTDADDWSLYRDIAAQNPGFISYSVGMHPCNVDAQWAERFAQVEGFWGRARLLGASGSKHDNLIAAGPAAEASALVPVPPYPSPVALGEIGLDRFHLPKDDPVAAERILGWQKAAFIEGLALAKRLGCPLVVHSRGAFQECVEMIDASGVDWSRVVFHCMTEGPLEMVELLKRGGFASFTGVVTYKTAENVRAAALAQGLARLMIETDAPYLTPMPHRGKPNEPAFIRHTADYCAGLFGVSYEKLAEVTTANAKKFFGI